MPYLSASVLSWQYLKVQKMPKPNVIQINDGKREFNNHVWIDWLVAIFGNNLSILALVSSDRIVYKLKNKKIDLRNEFK
jgi:hypothetical protein